MKFEKGPKFFVPFSIICFASCTAKKLSYAIAMPTPNKRIAKRVFSSELSIDSPIFCPIWTPTIDPQINIAVWD